MGRESCISSSGSEELASEDALLWSGAGGARAVIVKVIVDVGLSLIRGKECKFVRKGTIGEMTKCRDPFWEKLFTGPNFHIPLCYTIIHESTRAGIVSAL